MLIFNKKKIGFQNPGCRSALQAIPFFYSVPRLFSHQEPEICNIIIVFRAFTDNGISSCYSNVMEV